MNIHFRANLKRLIAVILSVTMVFGAITSAFAMEVKTSNNRFSVYKNDPTATIGESINMLFGSFSREYTDLELSGAQVLKFMRSYSSILSEDSVNTYDSKGRLKTSTDARNGVTLYEYDANGNLIKETDPLGNAVTYAYDKLNRLTNIKYQSIDIVRYGISKWNM